VNCEIDSQIPIEEMISFLHLSLVPRPEHFALQFAIKILLDASHTGTPGGRWRWQHKMELDGDKWFVHWE